MITLYSGIPGSGKTYKMVAELSRCKDKYYVVHNIDGLIEGYLRDYGVNFIEYCTKENMEVPDFFSKEYQIKFCAAVYEKYNRPVLVIIDEAHEWFSVNSKNLKMWLSYHRHIDQDIWLVAHRSTNIPAMYRSFIEIEYRAKSGAFMGVPGFFLYNRILGGQASGYCKERKKQAIFDIYKSQLINSEKKRKTPKFLMMVVAASILGVMLFIFVPKYFMLPADAKENSILAESKKAASGGQAQSKNPGGQAADQPGAFPQNNPVPDSSFETKWAFVGAFADYLVLEDRLTGEQLPLQKISDKIKVVEIKRNDSVVLVLERGQFVTLYNNKRHVTVAAKGLRQESSPVAAVETLPVAKPL
ncbi:MAG: zonular occludens toxin domain-containing protein [Syntrophomonas sp.]